VDDSANDQTSFIIKKTPTSGAKWKLLEYIKMYERREKRGKETSGRDRENSKKKLGTTHNTQKNEDFLLENDPADGQKQEYTKQLRSVSSRFGSESFFSG
jgi:hypothetical protein